MALCCEIAVLARLPGVLRYETSAEMTSNKHVRQCMVTREAIKTLVCCLLLLAALMTFGSACWHAKLTTRDIIAGA